MNLNDTFHPSSFPMLSTNMSQNSTYQFRCNLCDKYLSSKNSLLRHIRTHTGEKPYECTQCGQRFTQIASLNEHVRRLHTGKRPYSCTQCTKAFVTNTELAKHFRTHTEERNRSNVKCVTNHSQERRTLLVISKFIMRKNNLSAPYAESYSNRSQASCNIFTPILENGRTSAVCVRNHSHASHILLVISEFIMRKNNLSASYVESHSHRR